VAQFRKENSEEETATEAILKAFNITNGFTGRGTRSLHTKCRRIGVVLAGHHENEKKNCVSGKKEGRGPEKKKNKKNDKNVKKAKENRSPSKPTKDYNLRLERRTLWPETRPAPADCAL